MRKFSIVGNLVKYLYSRGYLSEYVDIDALTGVLNRNYLERGISHVLSQAERTGIDLVVVVIDLDGLKKENDLHGHKAGDELIQSMASLLVKQSRKSDLVIRMGGDEFLLVLWNSELEGARTMMERTQEIAGDNGLSFSFGLALVKKGESIEERIEMADKKMYEMKGDRKRR